MEKLVLIDGNSLINRAFYAMPLLSTKDGVYTNAVYGFLNMFFKLIGEEKPSNVVVAFDVHAPTFRHEMYTEYKGTRKPMPEELRPQIPLLKEVLTKMGVCIVEKAGIEADDIIGTYAKHTSIDTIIVTGDRDSFQLVDDSTKVYFTKRGITDVEVYSFDNFKEKLGIIPEQIIDLKSLMGDASDNIPGVPGVGEKTALNLIQTYGSSQGVYANIDKISGKLKEKLQQNEDSCVLSRTLATINTDCDIDTSLDKTILKTPFSQDVKALFIKLELRSLYSKESLFSSEKTPLEAKSQTEQKTTNVKTQIIDSPIDYSSLQDKIALSILDDSIDFYSNGIEYKIKIRKTLLDDGLTPIDALKIILPILSGNKTIIVFSKKQLKHFLLELGETSLTAPVEDLSLIKYLADYSSDKPLLDVIDEYLESKEIPAYSMFNIYNNLYTKLVEQDMLSLYKDVELPLADVLFDMEVSGFKVDENALYEAGKSYQNTLSKLESEIRELTGEPNLNVNSPKQLGEVLFEKLKIGKGKKTKSGYSTSAEILEDLFSAHPVVPLILEYRKIQKLQSTYIEGLKPLIDKNTKLIHTSFNQTVTATGRLSSKEPNLQNIPVREEEGKELRKFFVPKSNDRILIGADYSQIELRLLADFSNCTSLINAFKENKDIHAITASKVFNVPLEEVTHTMRSNAKAVNFGIIYGISEYGLAKQLGISPAKAKEYITSYFEQYKEVKEYMEKNVDFARKNGYAITMLKRRRYIKEITASNYNLRQFGERVAMNMPLQGSAADIIKLAMLGVSKRIKKEGLKSQLILQIHDELIIDAFKNEKEIVEKILKEEMENAVSLKVKLTVEMGCGNTWFETK